MSSDSFYFTSFEQEGVHAVRLKVANGGYNHISRDYAIRWLAKQDAAAETSREEAMKRQVDLAESATNAAWASANAAGEANIIAGKAKDQAWWAFWLSALALIISSVLAITAIFAQLAD